MTSLAPIALFVYSRTDHTRRTVDALKRNLLAAESDLIVFSDCAKGPGHEAAVAEVRNYIRGIQGFKSLTIVERDRNFGLAESIIDGVSRLCDQYGKVIVLEDDLVTSPYFLKYMNDGLDEYQSQESVISIHGYIYPTGRELPETFFLRGADCWGWATWKRGWDQFEPDTEKLLRALLEKRLGRSFDFGGSNDYMGMLRDQISGRVNSWAIRWYASAFLADRLTLYPGVSLVQNIGNDNSGTHSEATEQFKVKLGDRMLRVGGIAIEQNTMAWNAVAAYFRRHRRPLWRRIGAKIKKTLQRSLAGIAR
ncbi:glycosyl transferase [Herbaspirillum rhizosphaerae]|uniref:glycosyl transferase n=1 Tax=Herbaspirillum rhizosphaerae TaxID=346179 RepID=UPI00067B95B3|nr:glycosyl transferase [Herbaspirillum rhizosphaerae]